MKIGNKYLGISATRGTVLFIHVYLFGMDFLIFRDGKSMPFTILRDRIWWGTLNILWNRSISHD